MRPVPPSLPQPPAPPPTPRRSALACRARNSSPACGSLSARPKRRACWLLPLRSKHGANPREDSREHGSLPVLFFFAAPPEASDADSRARERATSSSMATEESPLSAQHVRHVMHLSQAGPVRRRLPSPLPSHDPPTPPPPAPPLSANPCAADQANRERRGRGGPGVQLRVPLLHRQRGARQGAARGPQRGQRGRHALGTAGTRLQVVRRRPPGAPSSAVHGARGWRSTQGAAGRAGREAGQAAAAPHRHAQGWCEP